MLYVACDYGLPRFGPELTTGVGLSDGESTNTECGSRWNFCGRAGLTLGYAVFVRRGHETLRLLSHEFRHVYQYEQAGSIGAFLSVYLPQVVQFGYEQAPFEIDARAHQETGE